MDNPVLDDPAVSTPLDANPPAEPLPPPEDEGAPEATDAYDAAQACSDFASKLRERVGKTLHGKTRKLFGKAADMLDKLAADLVAHGEGVEGELAGAAPDDDGPDDDDADDDDPDATDTEDEGSDKIPKSFTPVPRTADGSLILKSAYRAKRAPRQYKASELRDPVPDGSVTLSRQQYDALKQTFAAINGYLPTKR